MKEVAAAAESVMVSLVNHIPGPGQCQLLSRHSAGGWVASRVGSKGTAHDSAVLHTQDS